MVLTMVVIIMILVHTLFLSVIVSGFSSPAQDRIVTIHPNFTYHNHSLLLSSTTSSYLVVALVLEMIQRAE